MASISGQAEAAGRGVEGLQCYQMAVQLLKSAYALAAAMPDFEKYNMAGQLRRAALSAVLNLAEGYGRYHYLDKLRFFYMARGSLTETRSAFTAAHIAGYASVEMRDQAYSVESEAQKSLNGYISFIRRQRQGAGEFGDRALHEDESEYTTATAPTGPIEIDA